jgi:choline dehydrogenase-like flavoprotein
MAEPVADVIVVGSGPGGAAAAWSLARRGAEVAIIEAGPVYDYTADYRLDRADWERTLFPEKRGQETGYSFGALQPLEERWRHLRSWNHMRGAHNGSERRIAQAYHHVRGVGGSTLHFLGEAHRLHPQAMALRSRFGVGADWPFGYEVLEPYYAEAERVIGVAGPNDQAGRWRSRPFPLPPHDLSYAAQRIATGCRSLGLTLQANSLAILSRPYEGRPGCNYCANCIRGCPRADKGSADVTFLAAAVATGRCQVHADCQAVFVEPGKGDRVVAIHCVDARGAWRSFRGSAFVIACGAVNTPRLLLASSNGYAPHGLANESGQLGRNFMETLYWTASGIHPESLGSHRGVPADSICWDFNAPDAIPGVVGGCRFTAGAAQADLIGPIAYATRVVPGWGRAHRRQMREAFGRVLTIAAVGESLPNDRSFVDLDPERTDRRGLSYARIHSLLPELELRRLTFMAEKSREILRASGVERIVEEYGSYDVFSSTHVFGTCRMGHDPAQSVVNSDGRSHRWRNLFISDASVFPSSGGGEAPSLTIAALGLRAGEAVARYRSGVAP